MTPDAITANTLAIADENAGRFDEAAAGYRRASVLAPHDPRIHRNLGNALMRLGRPDEAAVAYQQAIQLAPDHPGTHFNLGRALLDLGRVSEAAQAFRNEAVLAPNDADTYLNLGCALEFEGRLTDAIAAYRRGIELRPETASAHVSLGLALLRTGELAAGWAAYERRWQTPVMIASYRTFPQPRWHGEAAPGRRLLVHIEGGFGDTLQFCRFGRRLAEARGLKVITEVQKPLVRLLRGVTGIGQIAVAGEDLPPFDLHCPAQSMPFALGTTIDTIPSAPSYVTADAALRAEWRVRLAATVPPGLRVGLAWAGEAYSHAPAFAAIDRRRSMDPRYLAPVFDLRGVRFVSLQKGGPPAPSGFPLIEVMQDVEDFADTAALMANLDLVIAVDTAVVHLAGAIGTPVWLLNRFDSCWRWIRGRRDSPWYPSLRLYRQPQPGDWGSVMAEVTRDLHALAMQTPALAGRPTPPRASPV
jgi:tetratricopeptide (TPR) repeat protein